MISISNNGAYIEATDYWQTEHAAAGLLYISGNAGALRLLVPTAAEPMIAEMRTGKWAEIVPSISLPDCWDIVFEDGTDSPFAVALDKRQTDRAMTRGKCRLLVYTAAGLNFELQCDVKP